MAARSGSARWRRALLGCVGGAALWLLAAPVRIAAHAPTPLQTYAPTTRQFKDITATSVYIPMRDGVRLAADVWLPKGLQPGERTATILHMTRYYRSVAIRSIWRPFVGSLPYTITEREMRERLLKAGYSWVDVDVRGTGASYGIWTFPFSPVEVRDGADVMDWIVKQPWAAGMIGTVGGSYNAFLSVAQLSNDHPALKAVVSDFGGWDVFEDAALPGGLTCPAFINEFSDLLSAFDQNRLSDQFGISASLAASGVRPVDPSLLAEAQAERRQNSNVATLLVGREFRDQIDEHVLPGSHLTFDSLGPNVLVGRRSRVPVLSYGGWFDSGFARGAFRQFLDTRAPGSRIRIGPWFHGDYLNASPLATGKSEWKGHDDEAQAFLDQHLRGINTGVDAPPPVQYFSMGDEQWRGAETWPPAGGREVSWYLAPDHTLSDVAPTPSDAMDRYIVDPTATSGGARWGFVIASGRKRRYDDRRDTDKKMLVYTSAPLRQSVTMAGAPLVELSLSANATDGGVFVYLEDVAPDGRASYVTEGQLRLLDRAHVEMPDRTGIVPMRSFKIADSKPMVPGRVESLLFDLLPVAITFPPGHSIRIAIAGADASSFKAPMPPSPLIYDLHRDRTHVSRLVLPIH